MLVSALSPGSFPNNSRDTGRTAFVFVSRRHGPDFPVEYVHGMTGQLNGTEMIDLDACHDCHDSLLLWRYCCS